MSQASELLNNFAVSEDTAGSGHIEANIVIGRDRYIVVPDALRKIGVQYDHNIETVTFDCPRYWDNNDMSKMKIYVNYMRPDGKLGSHLCTNVVVDSADTDIMHFDWTVSGHVTEVSGQLSILVCVKKTDVEGNVANHWNTELNTDMFISAGMKCQETILRHHPDIITQLLYRMDVVEAKTTDESIDGYFRAYILNHPDDIQGFIDNYLMEHNPTSAEEMQEYANRYFDNNQPKVQERVNEYMNVKGQMYTDIHMNAMGIVYTNMHMDTRGQEYVNEYFGNNQPRVQSMFNEYLGNFAYYEIVSDGENPTKLTVGEDIADGTVIRVLVPAGIKFSYVIKSVTSQDGYTDETMVNTTGSAPDVDTIYDVTAKTKDINYRFDAEYTVYLPVMRTDPSLTVSGRAADAAVVSSKLDELAAINGYEPVSDGENSTKLEVGKDIVDGTVMRIFVPAGNTFSYVIKRVTNEDGSTGMEVVSVTNKESSIDKIYDVTAKTEDINYSFDAVCTVYLPITRTDPSLTVSGRAADAAAVGNIIRSIYSDVEKHLYVDENSGSDEIGDGSSDNPYKTIPYVVASCSAIMNDSVYIHLSGFYTLNEPVYISGNKNITFYLDADTTIDGSNLLDTEEFLLNITHGAICTITSDRSSKKSLQIQHGYSGIQCSYNAILDVTRLTKLTILGMSMRGIEATISGNIRIYDSTNELYITNVSRGVNSSDNGTIVIHCIANTVLNGLEDNMSYVAFHVSTCGKIYVRRIDIDDRFTNGLIAMTGGFITYYTSVRNNATKPASGLSGGRIYTGDQTEVGAY